MVSTSSFGRQFELPHGLALVLLDVCLKDLKPTFTAKYIYGSCNCPNMEAMKISFSR
jgi:hypothetical protein